jgi:hypothetical protein
MVSLLCKGRGLVLLLLLFFCTCQSEDLLGTGLWLELPSSRAQAMAEICIAAESAAALSNPAQLQKLDGTELSFLYQLSPLKDATYCLAWGKRGFSIGSIKWGLSQTGYDDFGNNLGEAKVEGKAVFVGKAFRLGSHFSCGTSLLYCVQNLAGKQDRGYKVSLDLAGELNRWQLDLGLRDLGKLGEDPFETKGSITLAYCLPGATLAAQWQEHRLHLGAEALLSPNLRLRLGAILGNSPNCSWGIGLAPSGWQLDFAWRIHPELPRQFTAGARCFF